MITYVLDVVGRADTGCRLQPSEVLDATERGLQVLDALDDGGDVIRVLEVWDLGYCHGEILQDVQSATGYGATAEVLG